MYYWWNDTGTRNQHILLFHNNLYSCKCSSFNKHNISHSTVYKTFPSFILYVIYLNNLHIFTSQSVQTKPNSFIIINAETKQYTYKNVIIIQGTSLQWINVAKWITATSRYRTNVGRWSYPIPCILSVGTVRAVWASAYVLFATQALAILGRWAFIILPNFWSMI